jgi:hypothetical protein
MAQFSMLGSITRMALPSPENDWAFGEPKNVAVITTRQVMQGGSPILIVSRDAEDGSWQFLTGGIFSIADGYPCRFAYNCEARPDS